MYFSNTMKQSLDVYGLITDKKIFAERPQICQLVFFSGGPFITPELFSTQSYITPKMQKPFFRVMGESIFTKIDEALKSI